VHCVIVEGRSVPVLGACIEHSVVGRRGVFACKGVEWRFLEGRRRFVVDPFVVDLFRVALSVGSGTWGTDFGHAGMLSCV
jgi:hypothetical protein